MDTILQAFDAGGPWMYAILLVNIFVIVIGIERGYWLYFLGGRERRALMLTIEAHLRKGETALAQKAVAEDQTPLGRVLAAGLGTEGRGVEAAERLMLEAQLMEMPRIDVRVGYLVIFSNVATLLGLLGTIVGLIRSFSAVGTLNEADKATELARGISEAMNCTAFGLIVAITALILYAALQSRAQKLSDDLKHASQSLGIVLSEIPW